MTLNDLKNILDILHERGVDFDIPVVVVKNRDGNKSELCNIVFSSHATDSNGVDRFCLFLKMSDVDISISKEHIEI